MFSSLKNDLYRFVKFKLVYVLILALVALEAYMGLYHLPIGGIDGYKKESVYTADDIEEYKLVYSTVGSGYEETYDQDVNELYESTIYSCSSVIPIFSAILTTLSILLFEFVTNKKGTIGNRIATGTSRFKFLANKFLFAFIVNIGFVVIGTITLLIAMIASSCVPIVGAYVLREFFLSIVIFAFLIPSLIILLLGINYNLGPIVTVLLAATILLISYQIDNSTELYLHDALYSEPETIEVIGTEIDKRYLYLAVRETCIGTALNSERDADIVSTKLDNFVVNLFDPMQTAEKEIISAVFWIVVSNSISLFLYKKMERI